MKKNPFRLWTKGDNLYSNTQLVGGCRGFPILGFFKLHKFDERFLPQFGQNLNTPEQDCLVNERGEGEGGGVEFVSISSPTNSKQRASREQAESKQRVSTAHAEGKQRASREQAEGKQCVVRVRVQSPSLPVRPSSCLRTRAHAKRLCARACTYARKQNGSEHTRARTCACAHAVCVRLRIHARSRLGHVNRHARG